MVARVRVRRRKIITKNSGLPKLLRWSHALHSDQEHLNDHEQTYISITNNTIYLHFLKADISEAIQYYQGQVGDQTCNIAFLHITVQQTHIKLAK